MDRRDFLVGVSAGAAVVAVGGAVLDRVITADHLEAPYICVLDDKRHPVGLVQTLWVDRGQAEVLDQLASWGERDLVYVQRPFTHVGLYPEAPDWVRQKYPDLPLLTADFSDVLAEMQKMGQELRDQKMERRFPRWAGEVVVDDECLANTLALCPSLEM